MLTKKKRKCQNNGHYNVAEIYIFIGKSHTRAEIYAKNIDLSEREPERSNQEDEPTDNVNQKRAPPKLLFLLVVVLSSISSINRILFSS